GVRVSQRASVAVVYGATAMSLTLPAGQVFSTAFTYRQTRRWGASPIVASWQLLISGVIGTIGMLLLGVAGALLVGNQIGAQKLILTLVAVALMIWGVKYISGNPGTLKVLVRGTVRRINRLRRHPAESGMHHVDEVLRQLESVDLSKRDMLWIALWALVHRLADVACLGAACYAIGASPRWAGLLISFSVGKAVGTIPFAPGGLGYVDATLLLSLTAAAGLPSAQAVSAAFVYRVVSFIMVAIAGWIVVAFKFRGTHAGDAQFEREFERHSLLAEPLRGDSRTTPEPEPGADPRDTERPPGEPA
ncbi:MAG: UPF0104 family protein, partial [Nocardia sp.]|nr:UPF0104 family protein [Nocardia sp.]